MRNRIHPGSLILSAFTLTALPALAFAAPAPTPTRARIASAAPKAASPYSFGARVGGMGFREQDGGSHNSWNGCRMNGLGVFGQRALGTHAYVETAADLYFTQNFPTNTPSDQTSMDRVSGLLTAAAGMRMFPQSRVSAFAEAGGGLELTTVKLYDVGRNFALPVGFVGMGGEIRVGDHLRLGAELRAFVMADYRRGAPNQDPIVAEPQAAAQGQFFARYAL